ncbi:Thymidylate kinase [subsurface metagenome]
MVKTINTIATGGLKPDLTVLLDISAEEGLARQRGKKQDRFEQEELAFHYRIREGYLKLAANEPERWLAVDASQSKAKISEIIWQRASRILSQQGLKHE